MFAQDLNAPRRRTTRRGWIASLISLALIVSILAALLAFSALAAEPVAPQIFYLKDGQVYYRDFAQAAPVQVTQQLFADGDPGAYPKDNALTHLVGDFDRWTAEAIEAESWRYELFLFEQQEYTFSDAFRLSSDGRRALYLDYNGYRDNYGNRGIYGCGDLYLRDLTDPEAEPRLIANDVDSFTADTTLTLVTYHVARSSEDFERGLYRYNSYTGEQKLILSGWNSYYVSDDGKQIIFLNSTERLYAYDDLTGLHYIADNISDIGTSGGYEINEDFTQVRFEAGGLYRYYATDGTRLTEAQASGFSDRRWSLEYQVGEYTYSFGHYGVLYCNDEKLLPYNPDDIDLCDQFAACLFEGTLYLLRGAEMTPIAENVRDFELYEDGSILYQTKEEDFTGDLYYWHNGVSTLLLEDISYFLHNAESLRGILFD